MLSRHETLKNKTSFETGNIAANPGSKAGLGDQTLLRKFEAGDDNAATEIYLRYAERLQRLTEKQTGLDLATRIDADQIVQSVFRTFFRRAAIGEYDVANGDDLWKLFLVISLNKIRATARYHRANKRDVGKTIPLLEGEPEKPGRSGNDEVSYSILKMTIDDILGALSEQDRLIVLMRMDGNSVRDISQATQRAKRTVERKLQEFKAMLLKAIK